MNDVLKYKRGQIWMARDYVTNKYNLKSSVQHGNRPVLIYSSNAGNRTNSTVIVLKVTSVTAKAHRSVNVEYYDSDNSKSNVILCNQITTMDKSDLIEYMYTLSDDIMNKVEESVDIATNRLREDTDIKIDNIYKILEDLQVFKANQYHDTSKDEEFICSVATQLKQLYADMSKYHDGSVEDVKNNLMPLSDCNVRTRLDLPNKPKIDTKNTPDDSDTNDVDTVVCTDDSNKIKENSKKPRGYWTKKRADEFISDKDTMPINEWMSKYGYTDRKKAMSAYHSLLYRLKNDTLK